MRVATFLERLNGSSTQTQALFGDCGYAAQALDVAIERAIVASREVGPEMSGQLVGMSVQAFIDKLRLNDHRNRQVFQQCHQALTQLDNARCTAELALRDHLATHRNGQDAAYWRELAGCRDPGLALFALAWGTAPLTFVPCSQILEIGCCELDWIDVMHHRDPTLQILGVDWRAQAGVGLRLRSDIRALPVPPASLDWVVSLSALEHIGLGHYDNDPVDPDGDIVTMRHVREWLKPGGQVYFDVPYRPEGFAVHDTDHRIYDDASLRERLLGDLSIRWCGYATPTPPLTLIEKPSTTPDGMEFHYVAIHAQKGQG